MNQAEADFPSAFDIELFSSDELCTVTGTLDIVEELFSGEDLPPISPEAKRTSAWVLSTVLLAALGTGAWWKHSRTDVSAATIALIPQTAGAMLWDVEHAGATAAAEELKCHLYWNAPTSESDVAGQVSLVDRIGRGKYQGLIVAPNHPLALSTSLRRILATGLPVIVVSASLDLPAGKNLGYIVNDDGLMGELAAGELARVMHGKGSIALVGLGRSGPGVMLRARAAESFLASHFPSLRVVSRLGGVANSSRAEDLTNTLLDSYPDLGGVLSFTVASTRGVHTALKARSRQKAVSLVGCEQDSDLIGQLAAGEIAAVVAENTFRMGHDAVSFIAGYPGGKPLPARLVVAPLLLTRENINTREASVFTGFPR